MINGPVEGDIVLLRPLGGSSQNGYLSKPLKAAQTIDTQHGTLRHADILGRRVRETVTTKKGSRFRILEPSLSDYVVLTKRIVTPVSPYYKTTMISTNNG